MVVINFGSSTSTVAAVEVVVESSLFAVAMGIIEAMERMRSRMVMVAVVHHAIVNAGEERRRIIFIIVNR